jgi:hypothetical protein
MGYIIHLRIETGSLPMARAVAIKILEELYQTVPELRSTPCQPRSPMKAARTTVGRSSAPFASPALTVAYARAATPTITPPTGRINDRHRSAGRLRHRG